MKDPEQKKKIMKKLLDAYDIDNIGIQEPTLNDIFVDYAGDEVESNKSNKAQSKE